MPPRPQLRTVRGPTAPVRWPSAQTQAPHTYLPTTKLLVEACALTPKDRLLSLPSTSEYLSALSNISPSPLGAAFPRVPPIGKALPFLFQQPPPPPPNPPPQPRTEISQIKLRARLNPALRPRPQPRLCKWPRLLPLTSVGTQVLAGWLHLWVPNRS